MTHISRIYILIVKYFLRKPHDMKCNRNLGFIDLLCRCSSCVVGIGTLAFVRPFSFVSFSIESFDIWLRKFDGDIMSLVFRSTSYSVKIKVIGCRYFIRMFVARACSCKFGSMELFHHHCFQYPVVHHDHKNLVWSLRNFSSD